MIAVCPDCLEPRLQGHVCKGKVDSDPKPKRAKGVRSEQIAEQWRPTLTKTYEHEGVELVEYTVPITLRVQAPSNVPFEGKWVLEYLTERMDLPESLERFPVVEDFYLSDARLGEWRRIIPNGD